MASQELSAHAKERRPIIGDFAGTACVSVVLILEYRESPQYSVFKGALGNGGRSICASYVGLDRWRYCGFRLVLGRELFRSLFRFLLAKVCLFAFTTAITGLIGAREQFYTTFNSYHVPT